MLQNLFKLLEKPPLYQRTDTPFWNDPHISAQMLLAHLDPNTDNASRKPEFIDESVRWILSLDLPPSTRLLDIGCGPGLYTKRFSAAGLSVTGMDFSANSIAYAKQNDPNSRYILQDYLTMDFESAFDLITLIWCDYGALIPCERRELLGRISRALKPGGIFIMDAFTTLFYEDVEDDTYWQLRPKGGFFSPNPYVSLHAEYYYPSAIGVGCIAIVEEDSIRSINIWNTCFTRESLAAEIIPHGFSLQGCFSDIAGAPWEDQSTTICTIFRKD